MLFHVVKGFRSIAMRSVGGGRLGRQATAVCLPSPVPERLGSCCRSLVSCAFADVFCSLRGIEFKVEGLEGSDKTAVTPQLPGGLRGTREGPDPDNLLAYISVDLFCREKASPILPLVCLHLRSSGTSRCATVIPSPQLH